MLLLGFGAVQAQTTYYTLSDGAWNNTLTVWSTNGVTPCLCAPSTTVSGFSVEINHNITNGLNLTVDGGDSIVVHKGGWLDSNNRRLTVNNGTVSVYGVMDIVKIANNAGGTINVTGDLTIHNGTTDNYGVWNIFGGRVHVMMGNIYNQVGGTINMDAALIEFYTGNLRNYATINMNASCFYFYGGNIRNYSTGSMNGNGMVSTGGNAQNDNVWSAGVDWCAAGSSSGIAHAQNCANQTCNNLLPIEYAALDASVNTDGQVNLEWATTVEQNTLLFHVERSTDGINFDEIGTKAAAGNSSGLTLYDFVDSNPVEGIAFYRLRCVDVSGQANISPILKVVANLEASNSLTLFPNPAEGQTQLSYDLAEEGQVKLQLFDPTGRVVRQIDFGMQESGQHQTVLSLEGLSQGYYILYLSTGQGQPLRKRLAITR